MLFLKLSLAHLGKVHGILIHRNTHTQGNRQNSHTGKDTKSHTNSGRLRQRPTVTHRNRPRHRKTHTPTYTETLRNRHSPMSLGNYAPYAPTHLRAFRAQQFFTCLPRLRAYAPKIFDAPSAPRQKKIRAQNNFYAPSAPSAPNFFTRPNFL